MRHMQDSFLTDGLKPAIRLLLLCSVVLGFLYPALVMGIAQCLFPWEAGGSIIAHQGTPVGSHRIGQSFTAPYYFWGRPSDTPIRPYNALSSAGANLGPRDSKRVEAIEAQIAALQAMGSGINVLVPFNLVSASGSGLDPEISPAAARYQVFRVAKARQLSIQTVAKLVEETMLNRTFNIFGELRVNVLQLNLALDNLAPIAPNHIRNVHGTTP